MQSVVFHKSVLGILRRDRNPYLKLIEVRNFLVSNGEGIFSFVDRKCISVYTAPYGAQAIKRLRIRAHLADL